MICPSEIALKKLRMIRKAKQLTQKVAARLAFGSAKTLLTDFHRNYVPCPAHASVNGDYDVVVRASRANSRPR